MPPLHIMIYKLRTHEQWYDARDKRNVAPLLGYGKQKLLETTVVFGGTGGTRSFERRVLIMVNMEHGCKASCNESKRKSLLSFGLARILPLLLTLFRLLFLSLSFSFLRFSSSVHLPTCFSDHAFVCLPLYCDVFISHPLSGHPLSSLTWMLSCFYFFTEFHSRLFISLCDILV